MPRLIDSAGRRREIAEATWRLIERHGLDAVSVRNVAKEAGLSTGSIRHAFNTQAELIAFGMASMGERFAARLAGLEPAATPVDTAIGMLEQLLPVDAERRREAQVWLAFVAGARVEPALRAVSERADEVLREIVRAALASFPVADPELAVEETYALVDGLTLHAALHPARVPPQAMRAALRAHVERLAVGGSVRVRPAG